MATLEAATLGVLAEVAEASDRSQEWPESSWNALRAAEVLRWSIPPEYGGAGAPPVEFLQGSAAIASACLTTAFILSQRESAVRHLLRGPVHLQRRFLPGLAAGEHFLTVGLSQLSTARQHSGPALRAIPTDDGRFVLEGESPWVTGADRATAIVVGATLPEGTQVLVVLPADCPGVRIGAPLPLAALAGSRTSSVRCDRVEVEPDLILAGPVQGVLGTGGGGGLETSCLALGLAGAATAYLTQEAVSRPELASAAERFRVALESTRGRLHALAATADPEQAHALRVVCTRLALQSSQAALVAAKGTGFVAPHPAQRWARQAQFFLVWSCPRRVSEGVLEDLLPTT